VRAPLIPLALLTLFGLLSQSLAQDQPPVPEDQQILEALETPETSTMPEAELVPEASTAPEESAAPEGTVNPNPLSSLDLEGLTATLAAPLFTPSRTGPIVEAPVEEFVEAPRPTPEVATEEPPPGLQLVGIVLTDAANTALLKDPASNEIHRLGSGEEFQGWSLTIVDARSVEFRSGDRVEGLKMFESFPTPASYGMPGGMPFDPTMPDGLSPMEDPVMMQQQLPLDSQLQGLSPEGLPPEGIAPEAGAIAQPPPENFDPQTGELLIPEEGPLQEGDPNAQQQ